MDNMLWELHGLSLFVGLQDRLCFPYCRHEEGSNHTACGEPASLCAYSTDNTQSHHLWLCHTFKQLHPLSFCSPRRGSVSETEHNCCVWFKSAKAERGCVHVSGNKSSSYLSLLSPLSGGARRPALGYSHYLGDVGLGSGFFSHWQHSLHCHHGKSPEPDITAAAYHTLTQTSHMQILWHGRETIYNV